MIEGLLALRHATGEPLVSLYGPRSPAGRGGTIALNFRDRAGRLIDHQLIEERAATEKISLRTGCFCNPGAGELALGLTRQQIAACLDGTDRCMTFDDFRQCIDAESTGAVRISLGMVSNFSDVETFLAFAETFLE